MQKIASRSLASRLGWVAAVPLFALAFGCGGGGSGGGPKNEVNGKVTLGDKPVAGSVVFVHGDGKETTAPIGVDGGYVMDSPPGPVKVYIKGGAGSSGPAVSAPMPKGGAEMPKDSGLSTSSSAQPPAKFTSPTTSGLTYEVKSGKQTYDIPLK